ncbi:hypothetical protein K431DRAFT_315520 [Polychaeton citri CBS 116435]|uniref:CHRD domain-containing protein n=1 Tax=Polychaeton citri CBS 116435 TaxID=1314669 RepID=A0A9P4PZF5_9PEZI|nr:hypothetical protein K431DRAFT_315520 [Polychaeton citri CBS 116435]
MKISTLLGLVGLNSLSLAHCHQDPLPFNVTYLFTARLALGAPAKPIPVPGGVRVAEPILNGTVSGPAINATIYPGLALPTIINNQTLQLPVIELYGVTDDGVSFHLHETGVGSPSEQMTRIELEIGGGSKYATLRNGFILATINPSEDRTLVIAKGYLVENVG